MTLAYLNRERRLKNEPKRINMTCLSSRCRLISVGITSAALLVSVAAFADDTAPNTTTTSGPILNPSEPMASQSDAPKTTVDIPTSEKTSVINRPLMVTSILVLGGTYGSSAIAGYASSRPEDQHNLYYPVVGPWMDLANRNCDAHPCGNETVNKVLLIADGVGQGLGALGIVSSFFMPERTTRHWYLLGNSELRLAPTAVGTGYGLGAVGRF